MCNCVNWCRDWHETQGGKYPPSEHAPGCDDYRPREFARIEYDGAACIMEPAEAATIVADGGYAVTTIMITQDQFDRMAEFSGF